MSDQTPGKGGHPAHQEHGQDAHAHQHAHAGAGQAVQDRPLVTDPVCGMQVDPATSKYRLEFAGISYNFCSEGCRTKFEADPAST